MRFRAFLAHVLLAWPVQYTLRFMIFWWAQAITRGRACTQVPHPVITKSPFQHGHIHWCGKRGTNHGTHACHGCVMQWYENWNGQVWRCPDGEIESRPTPKTSDGYGFTLYPVS